MVKGKSQPVRIYELQGRAGELDEKVRKKNSRYEKALYLHWERRWDEALASLDEALDMDPGDTPSRLLRERVESFKLSPPSGDWNGEYIRAAKK